jgi:hypothetical protein
MPMDVQAFHGVFYGKRARVRIVGGDGTTPAHAAGQSCDLQTRAFRLFGNCFAFLASTRGRDRAVGGNRHLDAAEAGGALVQMFQPEAGWHRTPTR